MKMLNNQAIFLLMVIIVLFQTCKEDDGNVPLENNTEKPGVVTNISVENLPGKAKINYTLPDNQDLLYVEAVYTLPGSGEEKVVKSSYYNNHLTVEGFSTTDEQKIILYTVNRSEIKSDPVSVIVTPQESFIWEVYRSVDIYSDFGGFDITAKNTTESDVAIILLSKNEDGEWEDDGDKSVYTSAIDISSKVRGLDTTQYNYGITVRDRWMNYTDTMYVSVKPLYETLIPKTGYTGLHLPGDAEPDYNTTLSNLWDGDIINWPHVYLTKATDINPQVITFDIGVLSKVSRVKIWDYPEYYNGRAYYYLECLKNFEIWGTDDPPADGSFENWHLLGTYTETKPSGLPYGEQNDEDYNTANAGFDWSVDINVPKIRYLRIRCLKNWVGSTYMGIAEVQVYGDPR